MSITVVDAGGSLFYHDSTNDIDVYFNKDSFQSRRKGDEIWLNDETYKENFDFAEVATAEPSAAAWLVSLNAFIPSGGGGGGDASAANQATQIAIATDIEANTQALADESAPLVWGAPVTVNVTDSSTEIVPANANRRGVIVSNGSGGGTNDMWISVGGTPVVDRSFEMKKGDSVTDAAIGNSTQAINGICDSGDTTPVTYQEAT